MSSKLILPDLRAHKAAVDEMLERVMSGVEADMQKANTVAKLANAARAIVDSSLAVNLAKPELALIIEDRKTRRLTASNKEWNSAAPNAAGTKKGKSRRNAVVPQ